MTLAAGQKLGPYEIVGRLGAGGMGEVWRAQDSVLRREIAIKVLREIDTESLRRFLNEARAAAKLNHPNIVSIYEAREVDGIAYIAMELVDGEPLTAKMRPKGLPLQEALDLLIPVARALEAAHGAGLIHRDLKPSNIMVRPSGEVKLLDFGLAKRLPGSIGEDTTATASLTEQGQVVGTFAYMSPEQAQGHAVDARTDIFSFGSLGYELFTGRRAFQADSAIGIVAAIVHMEPPPVRLPPAIESVVMRCLRKDPSRRFQTAADLRAALEDLKIQSQTASVATRRPAQRRLAAGAAALAVTGLGLAWYWLARDRKSAIAPLRQVTFDGTFNATPAFSPDGKLMAFSSDRASRGNFDIWVRQTAGGGLIRLTSQPGVEAYPQFSPDGTKVLYLSGSDTILEAPALGGPSQQVLADAGPFAISSRGEIAFLKARPGGFNAPIFLAGEGAAKQWMPSCAAAARPAWSPDGHSLLFFGECKGKGAGGLRASRDGDSVTAMLPKARAYPWVAMFAVQGLQKHGETLLYCDEDIQGIRRWLPGSTETVAPGTGVLRWPTLSLAGDLLFTQLLKEAEVQMLPPTTGGELTRVPAALVSAIGHFAVSRDGRTLVYGRLTGSQSAELVVRDLINGDERVFASHDLVGVSFGSLWPQLSPNGEQVVYRVVGQNGGIYLLHLPSGEVRRLATLESFQLPSDWSADGSRILGECPGPRAGICELDPQKGSVKSLLVHPQDQLVYPSSSWDGTRIVFMRRRPGSDNAIWTARLLPVGVIEPDSAWVRISPDGADCSRPRFSADASMIYYVLGKGGTRSLVSQKLNPRSGQPDGEPRMLLEQPVEITLFTGGTGPYPVIAVTKRGVFFSSIVSRGNLYATTIH